MSFDLIGERSFPTLIEDQAYRNPNKEAVIFESATGDVSALTYRGLREEAETVAGGFAGIGIRAGDKVLIHLRNCREFIVTMLALARLGAISVPSNVSNQVKELTHVVGFSDAKVVVTSDEFVDLFKAVAKDVQPFRGIVIGRSNSDFQPFDEVRDPGASLPDLTSIQSQTSVEIIFTSGTTSLPKGVVLTHANWLWSGERAVHWMRVDETDRMLTALPLFHVNAQSFTFLSAMTVGATAIFLEEYSAGKFFEQVRRHGATHTALVAMLLRTLVAQPPSENDLEHSLRRVGYAINVPESEKQEFERRFGVELINGYGLSEAMTEVTVCPTHGEKRWPSIGRPAIGREVRTVDPSGNETEPGMVGEIVVHGVPGRTIMQEYYKDPEATAGAIRDGWLYTGDNGYFDADGYLYFFDRGKDMIKRAGENVSAQEVEMTLLDHPSVSAAAVIGVRDPVRDEAVVAYVALGDGETADPEELIGFCKEHLARFKVPSAVRVLDELPVTSIGKVEKATLRRYAEEDAQIP